MRTCLPSVLNFFKIPIPSYFVNNYINIKQAFSSLYHARASGMPGMLNALQIPLSGRHHSGIDDCRNITKILVRMIKDGFTCSVPRSLLYFHCC